jgi:hypothetical protein
MVVNYTPGVQLIVAADSALGSSDPWPYTSDANVAILGNHDNCGYPTGTAGPQAPGLPHENRGFGAGADLL